MLAICGRWDQASGVPAPRAAAHAQGGLLVSYRPLVLSAFSGPREASAEASRAGAGSPRREIGGEDTTRARPCVAGAISQLFGFGSRGNRSARPRAAPVPPGPIRRARGFNFLLNSDATSYATFFFVWQTRVALR